MGVAGFALVLRCSGHSKALGAEKVPGVRRPVRKPFNGGVFQFVGENPAYDRARLPGGGDMVAKLIWVLFLSGCCGVNTVAQTPPAAPAAETAVPIQFEVMVTDKAGNPIPGLKQEDFKLTDNRQPVTIRSFTERKAGDGSSAALVIVLDNLNADFNSVTTERLQLEKYFQQNGGRLTNPVGVFVLNEGGLEELTPISADGNALAGALHDKKAETTMTRTSVGFYGAEERLNTSLQALSELCRYLNTDGRKVVVWLGPGWPVIDSSEAIIGPEQQKFFYETAAGISRMLRDEQITIHSVSMVGSANGTGSTSTTISNAAGPNGAGSPMMIGSSNGGNSGVVKVLPWEDFMKPLTKQSKGEPGYVALQVFAVHSGGTVVAGSNDIAKEIARCAQDASAWYLLTFDSQKSNAPNAWHDLDVKIDKPQVKVRTENGYYTQP